MTKLMKPVIVVPAYNRAKSLARLLNSIGRAEYDEAVELIISLEGGASDDVKAVAESFSSDKLRIVIAEHSERLGLRSHILECGDYSLKYGSVIVLEDDLFVDRYFYRYAQAALENYAVDNAVAGIALYAQEINESTGLPFRPMGNGYSVYPMRVPCSSGQCWTASQWQSFLDWHSKKEPRDIEATLELPDNVKAWPESSWKKYFAAFLVQTGRQFIYPYRSYCTNCSDEGGEHVVMRSTRHQVAMQSQSRPNERFTFCPIANADVSYDSYMEPNGTMLYNSLGLSPDEVQIDTMGIKPLSLLRRKQYVLTGRSVSKGHRWFPSDYRPIEFNILFESEGRECHGLALIRSEDAKDVRGTIRNLDELEQIVGLELKSFGLLFQILKAIPEMIWFRIVRKYRKRK